MSLLSVCIDKLLFVIIFWPVSEHENDENGQKIAGLFEIFYVASIKTLADEVLLPRKSHLLFHQTYIHLSAVLFFYVFIVNIIVH